MEDTAAFTVQDDYYLFFEFNQPINDFLDDIINFLFGPEKVTPNFGSHKLTSLHRRLFTKKQRKFIYDHLEINSAWGYTAEQVRCLLQEQPPKKLPKTIPPPWTPTPKKHKTTIVAKFNQPIPEWFACGMAKKVATFLVPALHEAELSSLDIPLDEFWLTRCFTTTVSTIRKVGQITQAYAHDIRDRKTKN